MAINRRRFLGVFLVSNILFISVIAAIVMADTALAVPFAGVGGFTVTFDELRGSGLQQTPSIEENEECAAYPSVTTQMEEAELEGLTLYRDVHVPGTDQTFRLNIESDNVEMSGLTQQMTYLEGDISFPEGQAIEQQPSGEPEDQFMISGDEVVIQDGRIIAQAQFTDSMSLSGSTISLDSNPPESDDPMLECPDGSGGNGTDGGDGNDTDGDDGAGDGDDNDSEKVKG